MGKSNNTYLFTGGVRSGKSRYALELANNAEIPFYIATGWIGDDEMKKRVAKHQSERDDRWTTIEEQINLADAVKKAVNDGADFILVDCIGAWVTNLLIKNNISDITELVYISDFIDVIKNISVQLAVVSNETGMGLVPDNKLGRDFRDNLGFVNQKIAAVVDHVILMVSGLPLEIK